MVSLTFTVHGLPAPQGSKRHVGNGVMVESSKHVATWREDVKLAALRALGEDPTWRGNTVTRVSLSVVFTFARPRAHYRTGKHAHLLRDDAPVWHATTPDLDKLLRSTGDALASAGVFPDDRCIAQVVATKTYVHAPGQQWHPGALNHAGARITLTNLTNWEPRR